MNESMLLRLQFFCALSHSFYVCAFRPSFSALRLNTAIWLEAICTERRAINNNCENSIIKNYGAVSTKHWAEIETNLDILRTSIVVSAQNKFHAKAKPPKKRVLHDKVKWWTLLSHSETPFRVFFIFRDDLSCSGWRNAEKFQDSLTPLKAKAGILHVCWN